MINPFRAIKDKIEDFWSGLGAFIFFALLADILHHADGHTCTDECPYPWGKRKLFSDLFKEELNK